MKNNPSSLPPLACAFLAFCVAAPVILLVRNLSRSSENARHKSYTALAPYDYEATLPVYSATPLPSASPQLTEKFLNGALVKAVLARDQASVARLPAQRANPNWRVRVTRTNMPPDPNKYDWSKPPQVQHFNMPVLIIAAQRDDLDTVDLLLRAGADPNAAPEHGETALMVAAARRNEPLYQRLIVAGANPALRDDKGKTARDYTGARGITAP